MRSSVASLQRQRLRLRGAVQGVGFRPYCLQQARALGVSGWVRNDGAGLVVEAQGEGEAIATLFARLQASPPPLARIDSRESWMLVPEEDSADFRILASDKGAAIGTGLPADAAPCPNCLDELFDPADRRYRYPFINCTHCGPRYTLVESLPYDRPATSMAAFTQCPRCQAEYEDPADRRFHAQPNACPVCGPSLRWQAYGAGSVAADPLAAAVATILAGGIVALHGVGGFQLVCDATQPVAVERLRARKHRPGKPFAVMTVNVASLRPLLQIDDAAAALLATPARPIVLLPRRDGIDHGPVAPGLDEWGAMLPASPLHWLLLHEALGRPSGHAWREAAQPLRWVVTSANISGEPLVITPQAAFETLADIADGVLFHDRAIVARCDDSVRRADGEGGFPFIRRARGYVPDPIVMPGVDARAPSVLAFGGWMKNTVCVTRGNEAFLSPHIGDLGSVAACRAHDEAVQRLLRFLDVRPRRVAFDLHPDFYSSQRAQAFAAEHGIAAIAVQHHHAHLGAIAAEHGVSDLCGLILDGVGLGSDGRAWGGELLALRAGGRFARLGHLAALSQPGGDAAAREPWRSAAAVLHALGRDDEISHRFARQPAAATVARMLASGRPMPSTSSAGRLFDAAAALLGLCEVHRHEADAAMQLEAQARRSRRVLDWGQCWSLHGPELHLDGLWHRLLTVDPRDADAVADAAAQFHRVLAAAGAALVAAQAPSGAVALGGGCLINRELRSALQAQLRVQGRTVLQATAAPCGDGGLALGQAWIALQSEIEECC